jgi:hypothetical protein
MYVYTHGLYIFRYVYTKSEERLWAEEAGAARLRRSLVCVCVCVCVCACVCVCVCVCMYIHVTS